MPCKCLLLLLVSAVLLQLAAAQQADLQEQLSKAALSHDLVAVKKLVEVDKVDVNKHDKDGYTALQVALQGQDIVYTHPLSVPTYKVIRYLLSKGANVKLGFEYGGVENYTPLHYAAYDGNMILVRMFVNAGANVNVKDSRGMTPIFAAAACDFRLSCDERCGQNVAGKVEDGFVLQDRYAGARDTIKYLISKGADPTIKDKTGKTALARVPTPTDLKLKVWLSGSCKATYTYLNGAIKAALASKKKQG